MLIKFNQYHREALVSKNLFKMIVIYKYLELFVLVILIKFILFFEFRD